MAAEKVEKKGAALNVGGKVANNPARPTYTDFRCDVERQVGYHVPAELLTKFVQAYIFFDCEDPIEMEMYADKIIGPGRHAVEQKLGAMFRKHSLFPVSKYFNSVRKQVQNA